MNRSMIAAAAAALLSAAPLLAQDARLAPSLGDAVDVADDFQRPEAVLFAAARVTRFDPAIGRGLLQWERHVRRPSLNFNKVDRGWSRAEATEFPGTEYDRDPALPFTIAFVSPRTVRIRLSSRDLPLDHAHDSASLMLAGPVPRDGSWRMTQTDSAVTWSGQHGRVRLVKDPWAIELYDAAGRLVTSTQRLGQPASFTPFTPFGFVRRPRDV